MSVTCTLATDNENNINSFWTVQSAVQNGSAELTSNSTGQFGSESLVLVEVQPALNETRPLMIKKLVYQPNGQNCEFGSTAGNNLVLIGDAYDLLVTRPYFYGGSGIESVGKINVENVTETKNGITSNYQNLFYDGLMVSSTTDALGGSYGNYDSWYNWEGVDASQTFQGLMNDQMISGRSVCSYWSFEPLSLADETDQGCEQCGTAGGPINLADGNVYIQQTDFAVPGLGGGLQLQRTWNSKWPAAQAGSKIGIFGTNWKSTVEERVFLSDNLYKWSRYDGSFWSFSQGANNTFVLIAPANGGAKLQANGQYWTITLKGGEKHVFDSSSGSLIAIIDRNGNTTSFTYDGLNRLLQIADPAKRTLNLSYDPTHNYLVTSVSSSVGTTTIYNYDSKQRLAKVTKPDGSYVTFDYDSNSNIVAVRDPLGKILESHTYDGQNRGLTSARANGVEAVTVSYPQ